MTRKIALRLVGVILIFIASCSSGPEVKRQDYAQLLNHRTYEYDFPVVWKAIEETLHNYKIIKKDPQDADANQMRQLRRRTLETDWIYSRSNDKYVEYKVNDLPRKQYLQTRFKFGIEAQSLIGGVEVQVHLQEEIERLKEDGSPLGWEKPAETDGARSSDLLERINMSILSAVP